MENNLVLRTSDLVLREATLSEYEGLVHRAQGHILTQETKQFMNSWATMPDGLFQDNKLDWVKKKREDPRGEEFNLNLTAFVDGVAIGDMTLEGDRGWQEESCLSTGSWIIDSYQNKGYGLQMRRAMLHFAFDYLSLDFVTTWAVKENLGSIKINQKLGYSYIGDDEKTWLSPRDEREEISPRIVTGWRLNREDYKDNTQDIQVKNFDSFKDCYELEAYCLSRKSSL